MTAVQKNAFLIILSALLIILPFAMRPFIGLGYPVIPFFGLNWLGLIAIFSLLIAFCLISHKKYIIIPKGSLLFFLFIALLAWQLIFNKPAYWSTGFMYILSFLLAWFLMVVGATLSANIKLSSINRIFSWGLVLLASANAVIGLMQVFELFPVLTPKSGPNKNYCGNCAVGFAGHLNLYAFLLSLGFFSLVYLFINQPRYKTGLLVFLLIFIAAFTFIYSRAVYLYLAAGMLLTAFFYYRNRTREFRNAFIVIALFFSAFFTLQAISPADTLKASLTEKTTVKASYSGQQNLNAFERLTSDENKGNQLSSRAEAWVTALKVFFSSPLTGVGVWNYSWNHFLATEKSVNASFGHPHNLYLYFLATTGIVGFLITAGLTWIIAKALYRNSINREYWLPGMIVLVTLLYSNLEFPLWFYPILGFFMINVGILMPSGFSYLLTTRYVLLFCIIFITAFFVIFDTYGVYKNLSFFQHAKISVSKKVEYIQAARKNWILRPYVDVFAIAPEPANLVQSSNKLKISNKQIRFKPVPSILFDHVILLAINGKLGEAIRSYKKITSVHPELVAKTKSYCGVNKKISDDLDVFCRNVALSL